jgi:hypothetical protein
MVIGVCGHHGGLVQRLVTKGNTHEPDSAIIPSQVMEARLALEKVSMIPLALIEDVKPVR